ncbi:MAG: phosphodiester glycosidase family protein, partial [Mycobacterium sp.]
AFLKQRPHTDLATQSGPMLVINGRLHPRFDRRSTSLKTRDGVGVRADGKVVFAISQGEVSFDAFARLFRGGLNCPNALFLDGGSASSLCAPSFNRHSNTCRLARCWLYSREIGAQVGTNQGCTRNQFD